MKNSMKRYEGVGEIAVIPHLTSSHISSPHVSRNRKPRSVRENGLISGFREYRYFLCYKGQKHSSLDWNIPISNRTRVSTSLWVTWLSGMKNANDIWPVHSILMDFNYIQRIYKIDVECTNSESRRLPSDRYYKLEKRLFQMVKLGFHNSLFFHPLFSNSNLRMYHAVTYGT